MDVTIKHSLQEEILNLAEKYAYFKKRDRRIVEEKLAQWDEEKLKDLWNRLKKMERKSLRDAFKNMETKDRNSEERKINNLLEGKLEME